MYKVKAAKQALKDGIKGYLLKDEQGNYLLDKVQRLPFYLEGAPGIGKTQIVSQIAQELGIGFVSFSITHHTRNSLLGLPVIKDVENGKYTEYTMSEIIAKVYEEKAKGYEEGILLLDEFASVSETILPTMLAFLQTKNIGMYSLPDGWQIVTCGNPPEYNRSARKFDAAITDRMRKLSIEFSYPDFMEYAKAHEFHECVIAYLEKHYADVYHCVQTAGEMELVTCRSWENLSSAMKANEQIGARTDREFVQQFLKYDMIAGRFMQFYEVWESGLTNEDIDNILCGKNLASYQEKWKKKPARYWMNILDFLARTVEAGSKKKSMEELSEQLANMFRLVEGITWEKSLKEKIYTGINESKKLLQVVTAVKNNEYLTVGKAMYGF